MPASRPSATASGKPEHRARDAAEDADQAGDDELAAHVRVEHLADAAPDLVEVGAVVVGHEAPEDPPERCGVEREQEGDDEHEQELQQGGQRGERRC